MSNFKKPLLWNVIGTFDSSFHFFWPSSDVGFSPSLVRQHVMRQRIRVDLGLDFGAVQSSWGSKDPVSLMVPRYPQSFRSQHISMVSEWLVGNTWTSYDTSRCSRVKLPCFRIFSTHGMSQYEVTSTDGSSYVFGTASTAYPKRMDGELRRFSRWITGMRPKSWHNPEMKGFVNLQKQQHFYFYSIFQFEFFHPCRPFVGIPAQVELVSPTARQGSPGQIFPTKTQLDVSCFLAGWWSMVLFLGCMIFAWPKRVRVFSPFLGGSKEAVAWMGKNGSETFADFRLHITLNGGYHCESQVKNLGDRM